MLSDNMIESLSWFLSFWEAGAGHPEDEQIVLTKLIPTNNGPGLRPISLFRSIVRLHHRPRGAKVKEWHRDHATASHNNRVGRHVGDACYRAQMLAAEFLGENQDKHRSWLKSKRN